MRGKRWLWECEVGSFSKHWGWCGKRRHGNRLCETNEKRKRKLLAYLGVEKKGNRMWCDKSNITLKEEGQSRI